MTAPLHHWPDVLVEAEQVCRVVLVFQRDEPVEVAAVGGLYPGCAFLCVEMVDVHLPTRKRLDGSPELAGPLDMPGRFRDIRPLGDDVVIPLVIAGSERSLVRIHTGRGAVQMEKQ